MNISYFGYLALDAAICFSFSKSRLISHVELGSGMTQKCEWFYFTQ